MILNETSLKGAYRLESEFNQDKRGFFSRIFDEKWFISEGLNTKWVQWSISFNHKKGTLRGMHYQLPPHDEIKLVRCTRGAIYDVIIDLRPNSITYSGWHALELTENSRDQLYIPKGFAHGFLTLCDETEVTYCISEPYMAEFSAGVRWDDPVFEIVWPVPISIISERDQYFPDFNDK